MKIVPGQSNEPEKKRDWRVSVTLATVWIVALIVVINSELDISVSMLAIATAFFVLLIPTMNDLVQSVERFFPGHSRSSDDDQNDGVEHER